MTSTRNQVPELGFFDYITNTFGSEARQLMKYWAKLMNSSASMTNRRSFLLNCRRLKVFPAHILGAARITSYQLTISTGVTEAIVQKERHRLACRLLKVEIDSTHRRIRFLRSQIRQSETELFQLLPRRLVDDFFRTFNRTYQSKFNRIKANNVRKLEYLKSQQLCPTIPVKDSWFKNISDLPVPQLVSEFLSLGPKHTVRPRIQDFSLVGLLSDISFITCELGEHQRNLLHARAVNVVTNYVNSQKSSGYRSHKSYQATKQFLKQHPELLVLKADKGNVTVLMKREEYHTLALQLLEDPASYVRLPSDPTSTIQQKANRLVSQLKKGGYITDSVAKRSMVYDFSFPVFYGLPKIHKPVLSLRPIISSVNAPTRNLAKLITGILTSSYSKNNQYYIQDSFEFADFANDFQLPDGYRLLSLDVVSLFSNITVQLAIRAIEKRWRDISEHCSIPRDKFLEIVRFLFDSTYFSFGGLFYKQILGTPMGASMSPIIAQIVMDDLLDESIPRLPFQLPFLKKYVDDTITAVPVGEESVMLRIFNQYNHHIQFTMEKEVDSGVPFLDTRLIRGEDQIIRCDWYRKETSSGRYLNYHSFHDARMKANVILGLRRRVFNISHRTFYHKNVKLLFSILSDNSYPRHLLTRLLYSSTVYNIKKADRHPMEYPNTSEHEQPPGNIPPTRYCSIPRIDEQLFRKLSIIFKDCDDVRIVPRAVKYVGQLFSRTKDKVPLSQRSNVVYRISCGDCPLKYIGQTSNNLSIRLALHRSDTVHRQDRCSLAGHVRDTKHRMDYNRVEILDQEKNTVKRLFLEMSRVLQQEDCINSRSDIAGFTNIFSHLIARDYDIRHLAFYNGSEITHS